MTRFVHGFLIVAALVAGLIVNGIFAAAAFRRSYLLWTGAALLVAGMGVAFLVR